MQGIFKKKERFTSTDMHQLNNDLKNEFKDVKEELGEHLDSINDNTTEIQANYEYICKLESKIDKLNERLDNLQMFLKGITTTDDKITEEHQIQLLSDQEKKVFLVIYTSGNIPLSIKDVSDRLKLSLTLVGEYITTMIEKGVPLIKVYKDKKPYYKVGQRFIEMQARDNVLKIGQRTLF